MTKIIICVCGAGTMGSGIAQAAAQAGFYTLLYDPVSKVLDNAKSGIDKNLQRLVDKEKISKDEKEIILQRINFLDDIQFCQADVFIEAIVEKIDIKINLFNQLAELNHSECVFATNTSSLSVSAIAKKVQRPERVIGMHFFNPATIMKLVEVVSTSFTNTQTTKMIVELAKAMGKTPVLCKDAPGFIVNHVARPYYIESLRLSEEGISNFEAIDRLLEATGFKMGPFHLMDLIGNDVNYAVSCSVYDQMGNPERLKPSYIQEEKVKAGKLGKKTGEGYFAYQP
ncbi:MAG TPA: 3-hydroxyacyl-CoA dehydrogenase NAD-binding domain-containing protein [Chitinophagaceae bacterium]|jgi:3-hydroxybutyryl-CoA dehydrogenase|nr:3-hydroxyacyl-CoA dehydrogenase NAD-binding domain-containing protein [Chitinophagaceae bacterium]